ncbi:MAG TPA: peptide-methionine (R)-S-oxide reductase MsrB [Caulobacteraceae bacterium]
MTNMNTSLCRRTVLLGAAALAACSPAGVSLAAADPFAGSPWRKVADTDWKKRLPASSYDVLRHEGTETPFSSPLNNQHGVGTFACLGCGLPLFKSQWKFDSGTGWPSFYTAIAGAVVSKRDFAIGIERTEYHCARCLGHQGHIFDDGPKPTGLRYCNNGVALKFITA